MLQNRNIAIPNHTAVRTALWRALHLLVDEEPYVFEDDIGLKLVEPEAHWAEAEDMMSTKRLRASIVARARFIEDLIIEQNQKGISQYVILGSGLDTFAQRRVDIASKLKVFEVDQAKMLNWKQIRLIELGYGMPGYLQFVRVDFEQNSWLEELQHAGFDRAKPAVLSCTGVSLYLTEEAIKTTLEQVAQLAAGSILAMTFYLPLELLDAEDKPVESMADKAVRAAGTPFISFFSPEEVLAMAKAFNFKEIKIISSNDLNRLYFTQRKDGLAPSSGEMFLWAKV